MEKEGLGKFLHGFAVVVILGVILFPPYWMVAASLKTESQLFAIPPHWLWDTTLQGYIDAFQNSPILSALWNSVWVTGAAVSLGLLVGAPAAYGISRYNFPGRKQIWFWYVTHWMLVPVVILIPFYLLAVKVGMVNNPWILVLVYQVFVVPLVVWLMVDQFRSVPLVLEEAALLDGLSRFGVFTRISLPLVKPGIVVAGILAGIFAWNNLIYAFILTPAEGARTAPTIALSYLGGYTVPWTQVMASATLISAPVILGGIAVHKYMARGLTMGAVK